jgi:anti-sigma factor RsiW
MVILLHRPLVLDTRLNSTNPGRAHQALTLCSSAASEITAILQSYARSYDICSTPFALCYTTYIAATIHVHVLAKYHSTAPAESSSGAAQALKVCLWSLDHQALVYSAAENAKHIIEGLIDRLGIGPHLHKRPPRNNSSPALPGLQTDSFALDVGKGFLFPF